MPLFSDVTAPAITPFAIDKGLYAHGLPFPAPAQTEIQGPHFEIESMGPEHEEFVKPRQGNLDDQFIVFQMSSKTEGPAILDSTEVQPVIDGSDAEPDVLISAEMLSFHVGENEFIEPGTRATLRMNFGKDESSTDKRFDAVFWSVAAGLKLYDEASKKPTPPGDLKSDFQQAFSRRPIEIPGGLGRVTFDVIKHKEPPWWKRVFAFAQSGTGKALISTLGFPAITNQAISVIDQLLEKLDGSSPQVLFKGFPMRLAFSTYARDAFTGGSSRVKVGCLNRGFVVFVRGRDFDTVVKSNAVYVPVYDRLVPAEVKPAELVSQAYRDPLKDVTYAVFRIGTRKTKLDPSFQYGP
jgi:hypothetical protein